MPTYVYEVLDADGNPGERFEVVELMLYQKQLKPFLIDCSFGVGLGNDNVPRWTSDSFLYVGEFHRGLYKTNGGPTLATYGAIKLGYAF